MRQFIFDQKILLCYWIPVNNKNIGAEKEISFGLIRENVRDVYIFSLYVRSVLF